MEFMGLACQNVLLISGFTSGSWSLRGSTAGQDPNDSGRMQNIRQSKKTGVNTIGLFLLKNYLTIL